MKFPLPILRGVIKRRVFVNYRVQPDVLARLLPVPFRPKCVGCLGLAGICLIQFEELRPSFAPRWLGVRSENAAHRMAVEWSEPGGLREGVFIPRRDTSAWLNRWAGGKLLPGRHHRAEFRCDEHAGDLHIEMQSRDAEITVRLAAKPAPEWPAHSVFRTVEEATAFFQRGACGWSPAARPGEFEGVELRLSNWRLAPLAVEMVESSFFADATTFPAGSVEFDSAFLMRNVAHEWRSLGRLGVPRVRAHRHHHGHAAYFELA